MTSSIATPSETPVACTLGAGDYKERLAQIAAVARDALLSHERHGLTLTLKYAASAAARVGEMVRRERECCAFLTFAVREEAERIVVTVSAPEGARIAAEAMFEQFVTPAASGSTKAACELSLAPAQPPSAVRPVSHP
jgi:hypothetical protein